MQNLLIISFYNDKIANMQWNLQGLIKVCYFGATKFIIFIFIFYMSESNIS